MFAALHVYSFFVGSLGQLSSCTNSNNRKPYHFCLLICKIHYSASDVDKLLLLLLTAQTLIGTKLWCLTQSVEKHVATAMREEDEHD